MEIQENEGITSINVVPLVDIMLVLLLIFMVTARIMVASAIPLDLPKATKSEEVQIVFSVALSAEGITLVNGRTIEGDDELSLSAVEAKALDPDIRAVISADGAVQHRRVIRVMDILKNAGIERLAFGVSPEELEGL